MESADIQERETCFSDSSSVRNQTYKIIIIRPIRQKNADARRRLVTSDRDHRRLPAPPATHATPAYIFRRLHMPSMPADALLMPFDAHAAPMTPSDAHAALLMPFDSHAALLTPSDAHADPLTPADSVRRPPRPYRSSYAHPKPRLLISACPLGGGGAPARVKGPPARCCRGIPAFVRCPLCFSQPGDTDFEKFFLFSFS